MARHLSLVSEWELYIPDVGNERRLFEDSPNDALTMEVRLLSKHEREKLGHFLSMASGKSSH